MKITLIHIPRIVLLTVPALLLLSLVFEGCHAPGYNSNANSTSSRAIST